MQQYGLPLVLRIKYQPSSYKCSCAHTTLYIALTTYTPSRVYRSHGHCGEKKQRTTKTNLYCTLQRRMVWMTSRGPRITYEQRWVTLFDADTR